MSENYIRKKMIKYLNAIDFNRHANVSTCLSADSSRCVLSRKPPLLLLSSTPRLLHCFLLVPIHSASPRTRVLRSARFRVPSLTAHGQRSVDKSPHPVVVNENHPLTHPRPILSLLEHFACSRIDFIGVPHWDMQSSWRYACGDRWRWNKIYDLCRRSTSGRRYLSVYLDPHVGSTRSLIGFKSGTRIFCHVGRGL